MNQGCPKPKPLSSGMETSLEHQERHRIRPQKMTAGRDRKEKHEQQKDNGTRESTGQVGEVE